MAEILVIKMGVHEHADQIEDAIALCDTKKMKRQDIDMQRMAEQDWDVLLEDILNAKTVITV
jgi:hypothetical protein